MEQRKAWMGLSEGLNATVEGLDGTREGLNTTVEGSNTAFGGICLVVGGRRLKCPLARVDALW